MSFKITPEIEKEVYQRCRWRCVYCGFNGQSFDCWMQLTLDHLLPQHIQEDHSPANLVACCSSCNSITSRMKFKPAQSKQEILEAKRKKVREKRNWCFDKWQEYVVPHLVDQPLGDAKIKQDSANNEN